MDRCEASRRLLAAQLGREAVVGVGVDVGAQVVRRDLPTRRSGKLKHALSRYAATAKPLRNKRRWHSECSRQTSSLTVGGTVQVCVYVHGC